MIIVNQISSERNKRESVGVGKETRLVEIWCGDQVQTSSIYICYFGVFPERELILLMQ